MKLLVNIFLFVFITFLSTPTLIGMIDEKADTSCFYTMCEEEENHAPFNEVKSITPTNDSVFNFSFGRLTKLNVLVDFNLKCFDNLAHQIFSPPPNFV
ncbi:hypothetical protein FLCU109888_09215 [Flavobacterium cucumis]|uniref:Uncharacterized protein n=1 Tax=Flavobacterium cucumis TaxID=416016 RepID=A0A1M7ZX42_9FLAO|nr:hypothetical protein [Flavobacterium cucumis]SHO73459.1 hypothetical protein SAMN05443547_1820 [Flavobacterium cucumis]